MAYDTRLDPIYECLNEQFYTECKSVNSSSAEFMIAWYDIDSMGTQRENQLEIFIDFDDISLTSGTISVFENKEIYEDDEYDWCLDEGTQLSLGRFSSIEDACRVLKDFLKYPINLKKIFLSIQ